MYLSIYFPAPHWTVLHKSHFRDPWCISLLGETTNLSWQSLVLGEQNFQVEIQAHLLDISRQISVDEM